MFDIVHRIGIKAPATQVYAALASLQGLAGWWTEEVQGNDQVGGRIEFTFRALDGTVKGSAVMAVEALDPSRQVAWRCVEGPAEWIDTRLTFTLAEHDDQTIVLLGHRQWREEVEFTAHCSTKWAIFLLSLRDYVEKGTGRPSPNDVKIDDWN
ncbi:activator of HSP90 ATPase [Chitiniphilus shinanonensis]|uniref:Activator of HSP90 ATPase n=1 Tax=Chitiniphilus shinanonensis TaxID=553088 RepID=A0ABQ6BSI7_9NEIS|nr:SRPBCC domain-containing protein [Chitiniphilus shinanonensis]GLS04291.1 activator of HSP90 ATPase [Chitiniphilus shinanonensis]